MNGAYEYRLDKIKSICDSLLVRFRVDDYCGFDPYDGLNSRLFLKLAGRYNRIARIAWQQFHRRSPLNFRPICGIGKARNPKGIALVILGLLARFEQQKKGADLEEAIRLGDWLLTQRSDPGIWSHWAWGYHFHWAARAFDVPLGTPNAITTCYVARALYALWQQTGDTAYLDITVDAGQFLQTLFTAKGGAAYYRYIPGEGAMVHNASLWSAAVVAMGAKHSGDSDACAYAVMAARYSARAQDSNGAWRYGERSHHAFVDGFHTGYNLEALVTLRNALNTNEFDPAIDRGMNFFRNSFFAENGDVKYYANRTYPLDMHSVAQAVITLMLVGKSDSDYDLARRVINRAIENLYLGDEKRFVYQKGRYFSNNVNYMRWTQAWAFYALSSYLAEIARRERGSE